MAYINYSDLAKLREKFKDKKIIFTSGSFDLVHAGHVRYLEACEALGDVLIVGIGKDIDIKKHKGEKRPILNEHVRIKMIDSLKAVDYVFFLKSPLPNAHLFSPLIEIYKTLKPDAYVLNYDAKGLKTHEAQCKECGINFVILKLNRDEPPEFESISTTGIIEKIKKLSS